MQVPARLLLLALSCVALLSAAHAEEECATCTAEGAEAAEVPQIAIPVHPLQHSPVFHTATASLANLQHVTTYLEDIIQSIGALSEAHSTTVEEHSPLVDMYATPTTYIVQMDAPGYEDIAVAVNERGVLTISATRARKFDAVAAAKGVHVLERSFGNFTRNIQMPLDITTEGLAGSAEHGVLTVTINRRDIEDEDEDSEEVEDA